MAEEQDGPFDDVAFWDKVRNFAVRAGCNVIRMALTLYYAMRDKETPKWARGVILGALAYFVLPIDGIPDMVPGVGYADDLGVLTAALAMVVAHITDEHKAKAKEQLRTLFGPDGCPE